MSVVDGFDVTVSYATVASSSPVTDADFSTVVPAVDRKRSGGGRRSASRSLGLAQHRPPLRAARIKRGTPRLCPLWSRRVARERNWCGRATQSSERGAAAVRALEPAAIGLIGVGVG